MSFAQQKDVHEVVWPKFSKEFAEAMVSEGEEVLTLRPEDRGTQKLFVDTDQIPEEKRPPLMDEDWVVLCQALFQSSGEEEWTTNSSKGCAGRQE